MWPKSNVILKFVNLLVVPLHGVVTLHLMWDVESHLDMIKGTELSMSNPKCRGLLDLDLSEIIPKLFIPNSLSNLEH
ncbi:hypothetical protein VNO80_18759 [Phaseolus coccineus]|uniref:Uncharacterized protein n=1 Tax=Phaseolus coccineus TaxID=3886 RepID=A0AAN9R008_PHACN